MSHKAKNAFGVFAFALAVGTGISAGNAQVLFDPPRNFLSGDGVLSIVSEDFNNDGLKDIATSNKKTDTVSVHLNQGAGTFSEPWDEYHVGPFSPLTELDKRPKSLPIGVASGYFNNDNCADLVVANSEADTVSVLLNVCNGTGTFHPGSDFTIRHDGLSPGPENPANLHIFDPEDVVTGDFNRDGSVDIAVSLMGGSRVSVLMGDGLGNFAFPAQYFVGAEPLSLVAADLNNDGWLDLATANVGPKIVQLAPGSPILVPKYYVSVLRNLGDGTFFTQIQYEVGPNPVDITSADLNNDGWLDLVTANHVVAGSPAPNPSWVSVLMNRGTGSFDPEIQVGTDQFPNAVAVADLDGDGRLDLITVQDYTPGTFAISLQNLDGSFAPFTTYSPAVMNAPNVLVVDDFDGDLDADLLASSKNSDDFALLLNQLVPNAAPPVTLPPTGGDPDLIVSISKVKAGFKDNQTKLEIQLDLLNQGAGPAVGWFRVAAYLDGIFLHSWDILDGVQAGMAPVLKYKTVITGPPITGQELSVTADMDHISGMGIISESNELNNTTTYIIP